MTPSTQTIALDNDNLKFAHTRTGRELHVIFTELPGHTYCGAKVHSISDSREASAATVCASCHRDGQARRR